MYNKDKETKKGTSWRCKMRGCRGKVNLNNGLIDKEVEHYHHDMKEEICKLKIKNDIYKNSKISNQKEFEEIVNEVLANNKNIEIKYLDDLTNIKTYFTRLKRQKQYENTVNANDIFKIHKFTYDGKLFMQFDSGICDNNRFLIFYTDSIIPIVNNSLLFLCDSTFKICPKNFQQLLVIHTIYFNKRIPIIYILMKNKTKVSYLKIFKYINRTFQMSNIQFITDFELSLVNSIKQILKPIKMNGCLFHFGNIIWRKIQSLGYANIYRNDLNYRMFVKKLLLLSYVPISDVKLGFNQLTQPFNKLKHYNDIICYFYKNFITENNKNETKKIEFWNCYERIIEKIPTTTNSLEAWHKSLNRTIIIKTISTCLTKLKNEEKKTRILTDNLKYGKSKSRKIYNKQILTICENYKHYSLIEYIEVLYEIINFGFI